MSIHEIIKLQNELTACYNKLTASYNELIELHIEHRGLLTQKISIYDGIFEVSDWIEEREERGLASEEESFILDWIFEVIENSEIEKEFHLISSYLNREIKESV